MGKERRGTRERDHITSNLGGVGSQAMGGGREK